MESTVEEVLRFVEENDVKFVRLSFCDIFGTPKNIAIMAGELPRAFQSGIGFDASAVAGFMNVEESDLLLFADPSTLTVLPWRPSSGRVARLFCDIRHPDGTPFAGDCRRLLQLESQRALEKGYLCKAGMECEFYLFEMDEQGHPTRIPQDRAGYFDVAPLDRGENVRREICLSLEEMGIAPESSHHEQGPGQNEIIFHYADAPISADNLVTFKIAVRTIAAQNGLFAAFMPKPLPGISGSGLHINLSIFRDGVNLFRNPKEGHEQVAHAFIAGILRRIREITLFLNPATNSYSRFGSFEAPQYISWSRENRSQLIRIPAATGEYARFELRSPDPLCNPYLALTLLIASGMEGVEENLTLCPPSDRNLFGADPAILEQLRRLPQNLGEAVELAGASEFVRSHLPARTLETILRVKRNEWRAFLDSTDRQAFERELYFERL